MSDKRPEEQVEALAACTMMERVEQCRSFLVLEGFLSPTENEAVMKRAQDWVKGIGQQNKINRVHQEAVKKLRTGKHRRLAVPFRD